MSAHYTCLQGHSWPFDDESDICPICGTRALKSTATAVVDDVVIGDRPVAHSPAPRDRVLTAGPAAGRSSSGIVWLLAGLLLGAVLIAAVLGWLAFKFRSDMLAEQSRATDAEAKARDNEKEASSWERRAKDNLTQAQNEADVAHRNHEKATQQLREAQEILAHQQQQARRQSYLSQIARVESAWQLDPARGLALLYDEDSCPPAERDFAWGLYRRLCTQELQTLKGHADTVSVIAISSDGKLAASAGGQVIKLWDLANGKEKATLAGHTQEVSGLRFSPNGNMLASHCNNPGKAGEVFLWDLAHLDKEVCYKLKGHVVPVTATAFSRDGKLLISCSGEQNNLSGTPMEVKVWNAENGKEKHSFPIAEKGQGFFSLAISEDNILAAGTGGTAQRGVIHLWDLDTGKEANSLKGHTGWVTALVFADKKTLISGSRESDEPAVKVWDLETGKARHTMTFDSEKDGVVAVRLVGDHKSGDETARTFAAWTKIQLKLWDIDTGAPRGLALTAPLATANAASFSPDGNTVAIRHLTKESTGEVMYWDVPTATERGSFKVAQNNVEAMIFAPDGHTLLTGWTDSVVRVLNVRSSQESNSVRVHPEASEQRVVLAMSPDGKYLASGGADKMVRLWDPTTWKATDLNAHRAAITGLAFSSDGKLLVSTDRSAGIDSGGGLVKIWDVSKAEDTGAKYSDSVASIMAVALSPDGDRLAWGNINGEVKLFSRSQKKEKETFTNGLTVTSLAFSPDGKSLAVGIADKTIKIWDIEGKKERYILKGHATSVNAVAFSPDGKLLASVAGEIPQPLVPPKPGELKIWDMSTGAEATKVRGRLDLRATSVAFSPDGRTIATGGGDGLVKLWDVSTGSEEATLRSGSQGAKAAPPVTAVVFAPDGKTLYSADTDGFVKSWQALSEPDKK